MDMFCRIHMYIYIYTVYFLGLLHVNSNIWILSRCAIIWGTIPAIGLMHVNFFCVFKSIFDSPIGCWNLESKL